MQRNEIDDIVYSIAFSYSKIIGPRTFDKLLDKFKNPKASFHASTKKLEKIIGLEKAKKFLKIKERCVADSELLLVNKKSVQIILPRSSEWGDIFRYIHDLPIVIYAIGDTSLLKNKNTIILSIIGTRKPSLYGKSFTEYLTKELAQHKIYILSGLAYGIDSIAHISCIEVGGKTIAILGSGIDIPYPALHEKLYNNIIASGGLILSEYPPSTPPFQVNFIQRNRLISGLADGLIVIEGTEHSGTLITGRYANEQGKDVFALPGPITSRLSYAPHHLINEGATLITCTQDVLDYYGIVANSPKSANKAQFSKAEMTILDALNTDAHTPNRLFGALKTTTNISFTEMLSTLSKLEIKGVIQKARDGKYYVQTKINSNPTPSIPP